MYKITKDIIGLLCSCLVISMLSISCVTSSKPEKQSTSMEIIKAKGYFVKNTITVTDPTGIVFQNQQQLDSIMGMAATMGVNGRPTIFDFSKEYGVACIFPETDSSRVLELLGYTVTNGKGILSVKVITGAKQTYSVVPALLIKVSGSPPGNLIVEKTFETN